LSPVFNVRGSYNIEEYKDITKEENRNTTLNNYINTWNDRHPNNIKKIEKCEYIDN
jgi:hypothetical protein